MTTRTKIHNYYTNNYSDHIDPKTDELNVSAMAEDAITALNLNTAQEEIAYDMAVDFEIDNSQKSINLGGIFNRFDGHLLG